jgi:hypothetical protein
MWKYLDMSLVTLPSPEILGAYCRKNSVRRLSLFGSAAREDFEPGRSDVDLLVGALFGAKVDLNTPAKLGRFAGKIAGDCECLYAEA